MLQLQNCTCIQSRGGGGGVDCLVCTEQENKGLLPIFKMEGDRGVIFFGTLSVHVGGSSFFKLPLGEARTCLKLPFGKDQTLTIVE